MTDKQTEYPCGPSWLWWRIRKWISPKWACPCCRAHDKGYTGQGDRKLVDAEFRKCLMISAWQTGGSEGHANRELRAFLAGMSVTAFGWLFKRPRWWNDLGR